MVDAISRHVPGVLGSAESLDEESHTDEGMLEYPQYTKPEVYELKVTSGKLKGKTKKLRVPKILLSGNHAEIKKWRQEQAKKKSK